jgi:hypothetical protein
MYRSYTIIWLCLIFSFSSQGQDHKPLFVFSGTNTLTARYANQPLYGSLLPASYVREDLILRFGYRDMPFTGRLFIGTDKDDWQQSIQLFQLRLTPLSLIRNTSGQDSSFLRRFLDDFKTLEVGVCFPNQSKLLIYGPRVQGVNLEYNPGLFYLAALAGRSASLFDQRDKRFLMGKIGVGKKDKTLFTIGLMQAEERIGKGEPDTLAGNPAENWIASVGFDLSLFDRKFKLETEINGSLYTRNQNSPELEVSDNKALEWASRLVEPTVSSSLDFGYRVSTQINLKTTRFSGNLIRIGPGYKTLGNPYLRNDLFQYDVQLSQYFWQRKIGLRLYLRKNNDNLLQNEDESLGYKIATSHFTSYGGIFSFRHREWPYVILNVAPYHQETNYQTGISINDATLITSTFGYQYSIKDRFMHSMLLLSSKKTRQEVQGRDQLLSSMGISLNQMVQIKPQMHITLMTSFHQVDFFDQQRQFFNIGLRTNYNYKNSWKNNLGITLINEKDRQLKLSFTLRSSLNLKRFGYLDLVIQENRFDQPENYLQGNAYRMAQLVWRTRW